MYDLIDLNATPIPRESVAQELRAGYRFRMNEGAPNITCVKRQSKYANGAYSIHVLTSDNDVIELSQEQRIIIDAPLTMFKYGAPDGDINYGPDLLEGYTRLYRFAPNDDMAVGVHRFYAPNPLWHYHYNGAHSLYVVDVPTEDLDNAVCLNQYDAHWSNVDWKVLPDHLRWFYRTGPMNYIEYIIGNNEAISRMVVRGRVRWT